MSDSIQIEGTKKVRVWSNLTSVEVIKKKTSQ